MKKLIAAAVVAGAAALAAPAFAAPTVSLGYTTIGQDVSGTDLDFGLIKGTLGYDFTPHFGVEAEAGFGIKDESIGSQKFEVDHTVAAYLTAKAPINESFDIFGRIGYGSTKLSTKGPLGSASDSESTFNYGVGAQFLFDGRNGVRGEWTKHDGDSIDANAWTIAYVRKF